MNKKPLSSKIVPRTTTTEPYRFILQRSHTDGEWMTRREILAGRCAQSYQPKSVRDYKETKYHGHNYEAAKTDYYARCFAAQVEPI